MLSAANDNGEYGSKLLGYFGVGWSVVQGLGPECKPEDAASLSSWAKGRSDKIETPQKSVIDKMNLIEARNIMKYIETPIDPIKK